MTPEAEARFGFVQWEFAGRLGPPPGRYVVRRYAGDHVRHVVVVAELDATGAPAGHGRRGRGRLGRRGRRAAPAPPPAAAPVTRLTVIDAEPLPDASAARAWLERAAGTESATVMDGASALLARTVAANRVAAADPAAADADPARALVARIGYGRGEEVAEGAWEEARELPPGGRRRRRDDLRPQERLAALLGGRDAALASEELALRARADLDRGRDREAAMQLEAALAAALAELEGWRGHRDLDQRLTELAGHRESIAAAAAAARSGTLEPGDVEAVRRTLGRLEAALRARV